MKSDILGFRKKAAKLIMTDKAFVEEKYKRLYGAKSREKTDEYGTNLKKRFLIFGIISLAVLCISLFSYIAGENEEYISTKNGSVVVNRPPENGDTLYLDMKMIIDTGHGKVVKNVQLAVDPVSSGEQQPYLQSEKKSNGEVIEENVQDAVYSINDDTEKAKVVLPSELANGGRISWERDRSSNVPVLFAGICLIFILLYRNRFKQIEEEEKEASESIIRELPEFINKIILLLNAGIILQTSFMKIMEDREKMNPGEDNYFYGQMNEIFLKVKLTNSSFHNEFRDFSKRSGVREIMRISNIISDNVEMGSDLVEKLTRESEMLWFARKKQSEERGRLSETKLTFPLAVLLMVLVLITIAPAMLEM